MPCRGSLAIAFGLGLMSCVGLPPEAPALTEGPPASSSTTSTTRGSSGTSTSGSTTTSTSGVDDDDRPIVDVGADTGDSTSGGPDLGNIGDCDPYAQDCPDGEKCAAWADDDAALWNSTRCVPVDFDPSQPGDDCFVEGGPMTGLDSCDAGMMCWNVSEPELLGNCVTLCIGDSADPTCDSPDELCTRMVPGILDLCLPACDPLLQDCDENQGCYPAEADGFVCSRNTSGFSGARTQPCEFFSDCNPGLICFPPEVVPQCASMVGCCTDVCDLADPMGACPVGTQCIPWNDLVGGAAEWEDLGVCISP